jgi:hypothetical protein
MFSGLSVMTVTIDSVTTNQPTKGNVMTSDERDGLSTAAAALKAAAFAVDWAATVMVRCQDGAAEYPTVEGLQFDLWALQRRLNELARIQVNHVMDVDGGRTVTDIQRVVWGDASWMGKGFRDALVDELLAFAESVDSRAEMDGGA